MAYSKYPDWQTMYAGLDRRFRIGLPQSDAIGKSRDVVVRRMYVFLPDLLRELNKTNPNWMTLTIYADVVRFANYAEVSDESPNHELAGVGIRIVARRLEIGFFTGYTSAREIGSTRDTGEFHSAGLDLKIATFGPSVDSLTIRADRGFVETSADVLVRAGMTQLSVTFWVQGYGGEGIQNAVNQFSADDFPGRIRISGTHRQFSADKGGFGLQPELESPYYWLLRSMFNAATMLIASEPSVAVDILKSVRRQTTGAAAMADTYLATANLLTALQHSEGGHFFVPRLSLHVYSNLLPAFVAAAQRTEQQYQRLFDLRENTLAHADAADQMLASAKDTVSFTTELVQLERKNADAAIATVAKRRTQFESQLANVKSAQAALERGVAAWKERKTAELIVGIATAVVGVVQGSSDTIGALAKAGKDTSEVVRIMKKIAVALKQLHLLLDAATKIRGAIEKLTSIGGSQVDLVEVNKAIGSYDPNGDPSKTLDDVDWQVFREQVDDVMRFPIDEGIDGASDYQREFRILVIHGAALYHAQVAAVERLQKLHTLLLQSMYAEKETKRLREYIAGLRAGATRNDEMLALLFNRYTGIKSALVTAIQNYQDAYRYWALQPAIATPSVDQDVMSLKDLIPSDLAKDYARALESFPRAPQRFQKVRFEITDREKIEAFKRDRAVTQRISLAPEDKEEYLFKGWERVRLTHVKVWLRGASRGSAASFYVTIEASGVYDDRYSGRRWAFVGAPYQGVFQYVDERTEIADGRVAPEFTFAYFQPTPFTTWRIALPAAENEGTDISGLTSITLEFAGSAISSSGA